MIVGVTLEAVMLIGKATLVLKSVSAVVEVGSAFSATASPVCAGCIILIANAARVSSGSARRRMPGTAAWATAERRTADKRYILLRLFRVSQFVRWYSRGEAVRVDLEVNRTSTYLKWEAIDTSPINKYSHIVVQTIHPTRMRRRHRRSLLEKVMIVVQKRDPRNVRSWNGDSCPENRAQIR